MKRLGITKADLHPDHVLEDAAVADTYKNKKLNYSLIWDSSVGHHTFDFLAKTLSETFGIPLDVIKSKCQERFNSKFKNKEEYFPEKVCYYSQKSLGQQKQEDGTPVGEIHPFEFNYFPIVDTQKDPAWR